MNTHSNTPGRTLSTMHNRIGRGTTPTATSRVDPNAPTGAGS